MANKPKSAEIETKADEIKEEIVEKVETKARKDLRELINKDTEVLIMNNCKGGFIYDCPKTAQRFNMTEFGDTDVITIEQLNTMKNQHRKILEQYWILPLEVYSDGADVEDVFQYLKITDLYKNLEVSTAVFDNLLLHATIEKFKENLDEMNSGLADRLVERALVLFTEGKFYDSRKQDMLREKVRDEYLFTKEG